ncbi:MAG: TIGR00725 family protein [Candidatus Korarchaeota archaeon]
MSKIQIAVIGKSGKIAQEIERMSEEVGREIARKKAIMICGGRDGVMEAAARGCVSNGGTVVCILPSLDGSDANPFCSIKIPTGMGFARNFLNITASNAVIVINGSFGTLSEFAYAQIWNVPTILLKGSGGLADYLINNPLPDSKLHIAGTPEEAVSLAIKLANETIKK